MLAAFFSGAKRQAEAEGCAKRTLSSYGCAKRTLSGYGCAKRTLSGYGCAKRTLSSYGCAKRTLSQCTSVVEGVRQPLRILLVSGHHNPRAHPALNVSVVLVGELVMPFALPFEEMVE